MKSNYKKLGEYIRQIDVRNSDGSLGEESLYGISVTKEFIISHANLVGVSFDGYKIVEPRQFAYIPDTSRRGDKIAISLNSFEEKIIVSSICTVFEIIDENKLIPEYLMLWFMRPEFDRYARFMSNGSAREVFDWECMCGVELPIPAISEQRKIVHDFNAITDRISILRGMNENLTSQACTIIAAHVGAPVLVNKSNAEIEELSQKHSICTIKQYCQSMTTGATPSRSEMEYWSAGTIPWLKSGEVHNCCIHEVEEKITELALQKTSVKLLKSGTVVMAMYGATAAQVGYLCVDTTTNQAICGMACTTSGRAAYLYFSLILSQDEIFKQANGGAQDNLSKEMIEKFNIIDISGDEIAALGIEPMLRIISDNTSEIGKLQKLSEMIIARMWKGEQP